MNVTYEPRWHGLTVPVGMAIGPDGIERTGVDHALSGSLEGTLLGGEPGERDGSDTRGGSSGLDGLDGRDGAGDGGTGSHRRGSDSPRDTRAVWYPIPGDDETRHRSMEAVGAQMRHLATAVPPSAWSERDQKRLRVHK